MTTKFNFRFTHTFAFLLLVSLFAQSAEAGVYNPHAGRQSTCTAEQVASPGGCQANGVPVKLESWLLDTIDKQPATITGLDIYTDKPVIQVHQGRNLTEVLVAGTSSDTQLVVRKALDAGVGFGQIHCLSNWSFGSQFSTSLFYAFVGVAVGLLLCLMRSQLWELLVWILIRIGLAADYVGSIKPRFLRWMANLTRPSYYSDRSPPSRKQDADKAATVMVEPGALSKAMARQKDKSEPGGPTLTKGGAKVYLPGSRKHKFAMRDIIGQAAAKIQIQEMIDLLKNPVILAKLEARMPRGAILYGPPGTGKTLIIKAVAEESGMPIITLSGSAFVQRYVGVGAERVREIFDEARKLAEKYGACLIFVDEFDALGKKRGGLNGHSEHDNTLNEWLTQMDGFDGREGIIVFAATNLLSSIDEAALRDGRFDRKIEFFNPTRDERLQMIAHYLPERLRAMGLDLLSIARGIPGASGALIENAINEAKLWIGRKDPANPDPKVTQESLDEGFLIATMGAKREGVSSTLTPEEHDTLAVHEAGHALVYLDLAKKAPLRFTMVPRGQTGGHVQFGEDWEMLRTKEKLEIHLAVAMGGWAATFIEREGQHDTGPRGDNKQANQIAYDMVTQYGMSELGFISLEAVPHPSLISEKRKAEIEAAVHKLISEAQERALEIIRRRIDDLRKMVVEVKARETLLAGDFEELFMRGSQSEESASSS